MHSIGDRIRSAREALGMKQAELARRVGVSGPTICDLEKNEHKSTRHVAKLAYVLGVTPIWLAEGKGSAKDGVTVSAHTEAERLPAEIILMAQKLMKLPDAKLRALATMLDVEL